ncbi:uncharacterized protein LOC142612410 [Castanea sativa]|uniref:uncharacterized protein LOC142612410 n=1 Tax=Castanea sativa TaxID=21020 RepID=UPI003F64E99A
MALIVRAQNVPKVSGRIMIVFMVSGRRGPMLLPLSGCLVGSGRSWTPPPPGVFKINVDGASSDLEGISNIGVIIRDCKGGTIVALYKPLQTHYSADLVEVLAMEQGVLLAQELQLPHVIFESDAIIVINSINESAVGTLNGHIIQDIIHAQASFIFCSFKHLNRAFNYAAHELAHFARRNGSTHLWKGVNPSF